MRKLNTVLLTVATTLLINVSSVFADANPYGPYNPYTHDPIPTGFEDTTIFYIAAGITFITGMSILSTVKRLKREQSLA
mgnify:CR=1 FL=1